jgi:hypothetical protein
MNKKMHGTVGIGRDCIKEVVTTSKVT